VLGKANADPKNGIIEKTRCRVSSPVVKVRRAGTLVRKVVSKSYNGAQVRSRICVAEQWLTQNAIT
jgi:hypothetical protein